MNQPLVSVIIPTFNRAHLIGETLDSVLAQTYQNWECIIVDDGSSDNTDKVVNKYVQKDDRFKYYHRPDEHLPGGNGARNYGFKMSQGVYIQWFDSDDLMKVNKLEFQICDLVTLNLDVSFSGFEILLPNKEVKIEHLSIINLNENLYEAIVTKKFKANTLSPIFKKSFLINEKLFDEKLLTAHELDFYTSIFYKKMIKFKVNREILSTVRQSSFNSIITMQNALNREVIKSLLKVRRRIQVKSKKSLGPKSFREVTLIYLKLVHSLKKNEYPKKFINKELTFIILNSNIFNLFTVLKFIVKNRLFV